MIKIEKPTLEDKKNIFDLYKKTWIDTYVSDAFSVSLFDIENFFSKITPETIKISNVDNKVIRIIAKEDSKIVGFLEAFVLGEDPLNGYIRTLYIDPEYQRKGIGSTMLFYVKENFKGINSVTLETAIFNKKGIDFYTKKGFHIDSNYNEVFKIGDNKVIPLIKLKLNL